MKRLGLMLFALALNATAAFAQNTAVLWSAFDQGFAMPQSSSTMVKSVAGQAFVGFAQAPSTHHEAGFLAGIRSDSSGSSTSGVIVYSRTGTSRPSVWMRATDGSFDTMVVDTAAWPRLSHNGRYILFHKTTSGNPTLNTNMSFYDLQTRRDTLLFATGDYLVCYDWFSDDYHIAFDQVCSMMMMNRDRTGITTLYSSCYDDAPVVRPGSWALAHHNNQGLVVTDSLGVNRRQIPNTQAGDYWASWSPDGQWIAFVRIVNDTLHNYYKIHPDGTGLTALTSFTTTQAVFYNGGAWTPDGSKIVVAGSINHVRGLYAIATDGSRGKALLPGTAGVTVDFVGNVTGNITIPLTDVDEKNRALPTQYKLEQNYPNPFNPATTIEYELPSSAHVQLRVYDLLGREVTTLVNEVQTAGYHSVVFDASKLASGVYFYSLEAGKFTQTRRMLLIR